MISPISVSYFINYFISFLSGLHSFKFNNIKISFVRNVSY